MMSKWKSTESTGLANCAELVGVMELLVALILRSLPGR
jgi:hypothetical protein